MYQHYQQITNKGLVYISINFESRLNIYIVYASVSTANLTTLIVNFVNLSILSVKFIWLIIPALWFHSFSKITCVSKLRMDNKGSHQNSFIYSSTKVYVTKNVLLLFNPCMGDILQLRKKYFISIEDRNRPKIQRIGSNGFRRNSN